ncbi:MAG: formyltransferase family protein, partial [Legionella sp.]|uniref:formyltransferase family protein n=1 Tax=Legionella sp. TaxID=459 RepID=UPI0039E516C6
MEKEQESFSCYVIGNESLTIHCASILLEKKHHVLGIISSSTQIKEWCQEHHIKFMSNINELDTPCDYLFSIVNEIILPESVLHMPKRYAINYHNSPLPKYAGLYATSWAILNHETEHAISWHIIEQEIDAGDLVKQCFFPIEAHDTALSLNLKCYETASSSFRVLIDELASKTEHRMRQDLARRSYYGLKNKPKHLGFISWQSTSEELDYLCRARSFGAYRNELATPKLIINDRLYLITAHRKLQVTSKGAPGTIIHLSKNEVQITTRTTDIALIEVMDSEKTSFDMEHWSTLCSLSVGQVLNDPVKFLHNHNFPSLR